MINNKEFSMMLRLIWSISLIVLINSQEVVDDENNKFNEFVQIQRINGSLLCGGIIIDTEFVVTAASCLHGHYAERHIKDIRSDGLKIILSEYKSPNGLGLVRFQPKYLGDSLSTAVEEPEVGDVCNLLGWDTDNEGKPYQLANKINFTTNFLDEIRHVQIGSSCESLTIKMLICKKRLQHIIIRDCVNGQAEYSDVNVMSHNEWINKIYNCVVHNSATCKLEDGVDVVNVTRRLEPIATITSHDYEDIIMNEDVKTTESTTTTPSPSTDHPRYVAPSMPGSNSGKVQPVLLFVMLFLFATIFIK